jgi:membrane carboxypeptidase/penicillin-binding protein PbpC
MTVNPKTGEILTMVGSRNYFDTENDGNVNIMLSRRLAGSSFKPFAFASAFLNGYAPSTIVFDTETDFGNNYVPKNFDGKFRGPVSFRFALGNSLNIPAIKAGILGGIHSVHSLASKMGISFLKEADWYGSAISLGVAEVRPFDMAQAYSVFALGGKKKEFSPFLRILDKNNNVLFSKESLTSREERVLDEGIAYLVNDVLSDKEARGPGWNALLQIPGIVNASKTGTSNKNVQNTVLPLDGWTIGYTPEVLVVAWAGNNDGSPMNRNGSGYSTAGPIWNTLMKQALAKTEATEFIRPSSVNTALVSRLTGKLPGENFPRSLLTQGIFTSHNIPKTYDDSLEMIEVEKIHGDLPNEYTPESAKKQVFVVQWKSLRPNDENWQEPVESWAKEFSSSYLSSLGISGDILAQKPTKVTTLYTPKNTQSSLQLSFLSPAPFATVSAQGVDAVLSLKSSQGVSQVEFYLDTQKIKTLTSPPYRSFLSFPEGTKTGDAFTVKVIAYDALYNSKMITQDIVIGKDTKPPRVSFVSPQKDEVFEPFSQASFYIDAFDENGGISEVVWFLDGKTLGTKRQYPFSLSYLTSETEGEYTISVQVSDYAGNKTKQSQTFFVERKNSFSQSKTLEIRKVEKQNDDVSLEYSVNMEDALDISKVIVLARYRSSLGADIEDTILSELETISEKSTGIFSTLFRSPIAGEYEFFLRAVYKNGKVLFSPKVSFVVKEGR